MEAKEPNKKGKGRKEAATTLKANQREEVVQLYYRLRLLHAMQKNAYERLKLSDDPFPVHMERLDLYDRFMPLLIDCYKSLKTTLQQKQPGGNPGNKFRHMAFDVLIDHYDKYSYVPKAKELVKALAAKLPEGSLNADASGREPFSERVARKVIKEFKTHLNSHPVDWN
jgi:hypothetical protein